MIIKKYSNRRLYDTGSSRYVTLDELAERIRAGGTVRIVDAQTDEDLTQATLAQIILEGRRAAQLLPVPLLIQLIRMRDDALADFFGRYVSWALEVYLRARQSAQAVAQYNPLLALAFGQNGLFSRGMPGMPAGFGPGLGGHAPPQGYGAPQGYPDWAEPTMTPPMGPGQVGPGQAGSPSVAPQQAWPEPPVPAAPTTESDDLAALRREMAELRQAIGKPGPTKGPARKAGAGKGKVGPKPGPKPKKSGE